MEALESMAGCALACVEKEEGFQDVIVERKRFF